jgi:hypothetical protein
VPPEAPGYGDDLKNRGLGQGFAPNAAILSHSAFSLPYLTIHENVFVVGCDHTYMVADVEAKRELME